MTRIRLTNARDSRWCPTASACPSPAERDQPDRVPAAREPGAGDASSCEPERVSAREQLSSPREQPDPRRLPRQSSTSSSSTGRTCGSAAAVTAPATNDSAAGVASEITRRGLQASRVTRSTSAAHGDGPGHVTRRVPEPRPHEDRPSRRPASGVSFAASARTTISRFDPAGCERAAGRPHLDPLRRAPGVPTTLRAARVETFVSVSVALRAGPPPPRAPGGGDGSATTSAAGRRGIDEPAPGAVARYRSPRRPDEQRP